MVAYRNLRALGLAASAALVVGVATAASADAQPAQPFASVANNTLTIEGTPGGDNITVLPDGAGPGTYVVDFGNGTLPQTFDRGTFNNVSVFLGKGDDKFTVTPSVVDEPVTVDGGAGNDIIIGGFGADTLSGGPGDDTINGAPGDDTIFGDGGNDFIDGDQGTDTEILGGGQDTAQWDPGDGSDVIDGGAGYDTLLFHGSNAAEKIAIAANGTQNVLTRDVANIRQDFDKVEQLTLTTLGSADAVTVGDLSGTDLQQNNIDLGAFSGGGDGAADTVTVIGTNRADKVKVSSAAAAAVDVTGLSATTSITNAEAANDALQVNTLGGNDTVSVSDAAAAVLTVGVDLGIGQR